MDFSKPVTRELVTKTIDALTKNGITAEIAETAKEAKEIVLARVPPGSEVMTMTSMTLEQTGIAKEINESDKYVSVRNKLNSMDKKTQSREMQKMGATPEWTLGSVHAITESGTVLVASGTGSQLPAYVYGSAHVIWVVGTQKIVKNIDEGMRRIQEYIVPLESERIKKVHGLKEYTSTVNKLLTLNRETVPQRIHIVFVEENLGF